MTETDFILRETKVANRYTLHLLEKIPFDLWEITPAGLDTNVSWQVGHLILGICYNNILVVNGAISEALKALPMKAYFEVFGIGSNPKDYSGQFPPEQLLNDLKTMQQAALNVVQSLTEEELSQPLAPTKFPHPVAKLKTEAVNHSYHHTQWHNGQIAMLKRVLGVK